MSRQAVLVETSVLPCATRDACPVYTHDHGPELTGTTCPLYSGCLAVTGNSLCNRNVSTVPD